MTETRWCLPLWATTEWQSTKSWRTASSCSSATQTPTRTRTFTREELHTSRGFWLTSFLLQDGLELGQWDGQTGPRRRGLQGHHQGLQPGQHELHQVTRQVEGMSRHHNSSYFSGILWVTVTPSTSWSFTQKIRIFCCLSRKIMLWGCGMLRKAVNLRQRTEPCMEEFLNSIIFT